MPLDDNPGELVRLPVRLPPAGYKRIIEVDDCGLIIGARLEKWQKPEHPDAVRR